MNFCQKHQNHHCVHAHQCKDHQHQKHINQKLTQKHNKTIAETNQRHGQHSCTFIKKHHKQNQPVNNELLKQLHEKQLRICELGRVQTALKEKCDKLSQQNKHLYTQIQYYREQFSSLIDNNSQDNKNQIKKRIKQTTNLILKITTLQSQNQQLKQTNTHLTNQLQSQKLSKVHNRQIHESIEQKYSKVLSKLKLIERQKQEYGEQMISNKRQHERLKQRYEILKKECSLDCQRNRKQSRQMAQKLENATREWNKLKNTSTNDKEFASLELANYHKRQAALKEKLEAFQSTNRDLFKDLQLLKEKNQQLEDNLFHAKKVINQNQENSHSFANLQNQLHEKHIQTNTVIRHHSHFSKENRASESQQVGALQQQIKGLKQKIAELQKRSLTSYEQVILNMGASEAFKRLLEEKNAVIKRLMRQKGQIISRLSMQQHP